VISLLEARSLRRRDFWVVLDLVMLWFFSGPT
jgi:hypothetical protein